MKPRNGNNSNLKQVKSLHRQFQMILSMLGPFNQNIMAVRTKINELENWKTDISSKLNNFNIALMELANHEIQRIDSDDEEEDVVAVPLKNNKKENEGKLLKVNGEAENPTENGMIITGSRRTRNSIKNYSEESLSMNGLDISKDPRALIPYYPRSQPNQDLNLRNKQPIVRVDRNKVAVTAVAVRTMKKKNLKRNNVNVNQRVRLHLENSRNRALRKEQRTIEPFDRASYQQLHAVDEDDEDTVEVFVDDNIVEEEMLMKKREALYSVLARKNNISNNNELSINNNNNNNTQNSTVQSNGIIQSQGSTTEVTVAKPTASNNMYSMKSPSIGIVLEKIITEGQSNDNNYCIPSGVEMSSPSPKVAQEFTNGLLLLPPQLPLTSTSSPEIESIDEIIDSNEPNVNESNNSNTSSSNNYKCVANNNVVPANNNNNNNLSSSSPSVSGGSISSDSQASDTTIDDSFCKISFILPKSKRTITMKNPPKKFDVTRALNVQVTMKRLNLDNISTDENFSFIKCRNTRGKRQRQATDDEMYVPNLSKKRNVGGTRNAKNGKKASVPKPPNSKVTRSQSRPLQKTNNNPGKKISKPTTSNNQRPRSKTLPPPKGLDGIYRIPKVQKKVNNNNNNNKNTSAFSPQKNVISKVNKTMDNSKKQLIPSTSGSIVSSAIHMPKLLPQVPLIHIVDDEENTNEDQERERMQEDENSHNHHQDLSIVQLPPVNISNTPFCCSICLESFSTAMDLSVHYDLSGHRVSSPRKMAVSEVFSSHRNCDEEYEGVVYQHQPFLNPPDLVPYAYGMHEFNHDEMHYSETFQNSEIPVSFEEEVTSVEEEKVVDYAYNVDISMMRPIDPNLRVTTGLIPDSVEENDNRENERCILPL